jgi:hypothetical protein
MNNPAIKQTLIELEESLSKIESARNQVNNVSEKSNKLISSFSDVLKSTESLRNDLVIDKGEFKENLDKSFKNFNNELKKIIDQTTSSSIKINKNLETIESEFIGNLSKASSSLKQFEKILSETEERINKTSIKSDLVDLENRLNKKQILNLVIIGIGFVAVITIIFIKL